LTPQDVTRFMELRRDHSPRLARLAAVLWLALLTAGCGAGGVERSAPAPPPSARDDARRGPVQMTVEVRPARARLSDQPELTLTVAHEPGVEIELPDFDGRLGDFVIRGVREALPAVDGDRQIVRRIYTLEPTRAGRLEIEPVLVAFTDARDAGDGQRQIIESRSLPVEITATVATDDPSLGKLEGLTGPVALRSRASRIGVWVVAGATLVTALLALAFWHMLRRREPDGASPNPSEIALLELDRLWRSELHQSDVKRYYSELTGIVRRFIERTTGIHAPEQTTEEFFQAIEGHGPLAERLGARLREFLESADLVKFAAHQPGDDDVRTAFDRARDFVAREPGRVLVPARPPTEPHAATPAEPPAEPPGKPDVHVRRSESTDDPRASFGEPPRG